MAYTKNTWVDQDVERPKTYEVTNNQDGSITLTDSFGLVTELGTPVNAVNMNHIEDGIDGCAIRKHNLTETFNLGEWVLGGSGDDEGIYKSLVANNVGNAVTDMVAWEKVINEMELNNPYSLFDSKYSDHELNNLSWLKSGGQWNSKAVYTTAYDKLLKVYNGTETVNGLSVKLSTEEYTDYDFVLNTAEETFRLPLLDGSESLPSAKRYVYKLPTSNGQKYTALYNGIIQLMATSSATHQYVALTNRTTGEYDEMRTPLSGVANVCNIQVKAGDTFTVNGDNISTIYWLANIKYTGNGSLYYYVGETVQNANLIDAGRIGEQLATKTDMLQASGAGMPSNRYIKLTLGASGTTYTAPANGWFGVYIDNYTKTGIPYLYMYSTFSSGMSVSSDLPATTDIIANVPLLKGDTVRIVWGGFSGGTQIFRFIYAEGTPSA